MILEKLSLINYKNIRAANLELSSKINCLIGQNGVGKTNVLDAIYFLSFCHSASNPIDSQVITHDEGFFLIEGTYQEELCISCGMKRGTKKHFKRNKKEYKRLSEHIGLIPLVMISPSDTLLIEGGSEDRRKLMDVVISHVVISQYDRSYIDAMNRYNKALLQRNTMLKQEEEPDPEVLSLWEEQMAIEGERIFACRDAFVKALTPVFQRYYETISGNKEQVEMTSAAGGDPARSSERPHHGLLAAWGASRRPGVQSGRPSPEARGQSGTTQDVCDCPETGTV